MAHVSAWCVASTPRLADWLVPIAVVALQGFAVAPAAAQGWAPRTETRAAVITSARLNVGNGRTQFVMTASQAIIPNVFTLSAPYRIVIDIADVAFRLQPQTGQRGRGLVRQFRYGLLAPGRGRIVIDLVRPARFVSRIVEGAGRTVTFMLDLEPGTAQTFRDDSAPPSRKTPRALRPPRSARAKRGPPIIVIDPGHGGVDPGAIGDGGAAEKAITLAVAHALRAALKRTRRYQIVMTRATDVYISLDRRVAIAAELDADLFISLHADAVADAAAALRTRGASVYTLSENPSDRNARRVADRENASDALAGLRTASTSTDLVRSILIDLMQRESADRAFVFREKLLGTFRGRLRLSGEPRRSANFRVLRQIATPAVLVELGYMSNPQDRAQLTRRAWQTQVASAIQAAIDAFFKQYRR